jgi:hypothetical protein
MEVIVIVNIIRKKKLYIMYLFLFIAFLLQRTYEEKNQWFFFKMFYSAILGDAENYSKLKEETPEFEDLFFVIYFILTVFFIVIMLNLLIAIISATFETVTKVESKAFQYERLNIINETEEMYKEDLINKLEMGK